MAYGSLLHERRRDLHRQTVGAIEALDPDRRADWIERLANHAWRGEMWEKAATYLHQAGKKASARAANREAVTCFERALQALQHLPKRRDTLEQAVDLRLDLRYALLMLGELGRVLQCLREAESLAEVLGDRRRLGRISACLTYHFWNTGELDRALASGHRAVAMAADLGDDALQVRANFALGHVYHGLGDYHRALDCFRRGVTSLADGPNRARPDRASLSTMDTIPPRSPWMVWCLAELGAFGEGLTTGEEALRVAEAINDLEDLAAGYYGVGLLSLRRGDLSTALTRLERGLGICQGGGLTIWFSAIAAALGYGYALAGRLGEALPLLERSVEIDATIGIVGGHGILITWLGEAYLAAGRVDDAIPLAERALVLCRAHQERGDLAWALRLLGDLHSRRTPPDAASAEANYRQSLALADKLGMRPLQAHCHLGLGELYAVVGRRQQARTELAGAIELYRSMGMTFWLPRAETALIGAEGG